MAVIVVPVVPVCAIRHTCGHVTALDIWMTVGTVIGGLALIITVTALCGWIEDWLYRRRWRRR